MGVIVFGSINMDLVLQVPRLPIPGETISGFCFFTAPGGKGANQAVATARLGIHTALVGRVGSDPFGESILLGLKKDHIDVSGIEIDVEHETGVALIAVDDAGENSIVIVPGANGAVGKKDIGRLDPLSHKAQVLLLQLEIPINAVIRAAAVAKAGGLLVVLDPAPACCIPDSLYGLVDIITPNEVEVAELVGFSVDSPEEVARAAQILHKRGVETVIVKLGSRGSYWSHGGRSGFVDAHHDVEVVDTVAAGDAFNGALAVALAEGRPFSKAMKWAMAAGAISTTKSGAQPSMPQRSELFAFLDRTSK